MTINKVELAQAMFKPGHTVDIQAKVTKRDGAGRMRSSGIRGTYGERLAVVGKDSLTFGWPNRPFQVEWSPGEVVFLEVYDRKNGLFAAPKRFTLSSSQRRGRFSAQDRRFSARAPAQARPAARPAAQSRRAQQPARRRPEELGRRAPAQVADSDSDSDRPIVIK